MNGHAAHHMTKHRHFVHEIRLYEDHGTIMCILLSTLQQCCHEYAVRGIRTQHHAITSVVMQDAEHTISLVT